MAFPNNCNPRVITVDASTGCTLTRASIRGMTPQDFEDQGFTEVGMDRLITQAQEAKVAGVVESSLEALVNGRLTPIKGSLQKSNIGGSESVILPFIYRRQKRNINVNYFLVDAGAATPGAGAGGIPASAWNLTVEKHASPWATTLVDLEKYFIPGKYIVVDHVNAGTKVAYSAQFKILSAVNATAAGVEKATLTLEPAVSAAGWAGYSAAQKTPYQPTTGLCQVLANSVSDYESWCQNEVAENTNKLLTFWLQTTRETHEYSDEYLKALNATLTSGYFKEFRQLPLAEQKRIMHKKATDAWLNSIFYGQAINENQTVETYTSLPTVVDPLNPSCTLEYKANALGIMPLLSACSRLTDKLSVVFDLASLWDLGYTLKRNRQAAGASNVDSIDFMTDKWTAGKIIKLYNTRLKTDYAFDLNIDMNKIGAVQVSDPLMFKYVPLQLPPEFGYTANIIWNDFFDDRLTAHVASVSGAAPVDGDLGNRGRAIWALDWSDIQIGIAGTSSVQRQTNVADNLYNCVIKPNVRHYMLSSKTWTTIIEDPNRHAVVYNYAPALTWA